MACIWESPNLPTTKKSLSKFISSKSATLSDLNSQRQQFIDDLFKFMWTSYSKCIKRLGKGWRPQEIYNLQREVFHFSGKGAPSIRVCLESAADEEEMMKLKMLLLNYDGRVWKNKNTCRREVFPLLRLRRQSVFCF